MELTFPEADAPLSVAVLTICERYAHLISILIVTKNAYGHVFERVRRRRPMTVSSELLWSLTPPLVAGTDDVVVAGLLEPCYDMGGDALDHAIHDDVLHMAVFDAMGHGLAAAGVAAFALSAYRHSRLEGASLPETYAQIDAAVAEQFRGSRFITAVLAQLHLPSGDLRWVSAGHPAPLLLRDGRLVKTLDLPPAPPMGTGLSAVAPVEGAEGLEPGDMVLLYTDGLTEARRPGGELFTAARLGEFIERQAAAGQAAPETLRRLREAIIERGAGALRDDATALLVEWRRGTQGAIVPETV
jgi:serine phosphatase RsbU (regulator of sigma subunit)